MVFHSEEDAGISIDVFFFDFLPPNPTDTETSVLFCVVFFAEVSFKLFSLACANESNQIAYEVVCKFPDAPIT